MKYFDSLVVLAAFSLSTVITAALFAAFAFWAYTEIGAVQQEIVATALTAPRLPQRAPATLPAATASLPVVHFEPITVIGNRSEGEAFASAATPNLR